MSKIAVKKYNLKKLKAKFDKKEFAIPEIQRQYVWKKNKIINLLDSIYKNYPIGIGLVWQAKYTHAINIRPNNKTILPPFNKRSRTADLIIDGQQRLSTIYGVIHGLEAKPEANSDINFDQLYFVTDRKEEKRFIFSRKDLSETVGYISLKSLLNTSPSRLKYELSLNKAEFREVKKCYEIFHSYQFYFLSFEGLEFDDVKEIFIRINSAGITVNRADTLFAKASNVDLRTLMIDARRGLKNGFENLSMDAFQNTLGLAYGATRFGVKEFDNFLRKIEKSKKKDKSFEKVWKKLLYGYEEAADFLVNIIGISNANQLPSENIFSMLAYFFYNRQSRATAQQIKEIKKWFWHTSCGNRYSGREFYDNISADITFFERLSRRPARYVVRAKIQPIDFLKSDYRTGAATAAYFIMLRKNKPKYLLNGHEMMLDNHTSISNRKDRHHIFPVAHLRRQKVNSKWINSIANICYLASDENQSISDDHPRIYLDEFKRKKHFARVMKNHLIPYRSDSPIWSRKKEGYHQFLNIRAKEILSKVQKLAGTSLFEKFDGIKRL